MTTSVPLKNSWAHATLCINVKDPTASMVVRVVAGNPAVTKISISPVVNPMLLLLVWIPDIAIVGRIPFGSHATTGIDDGRARRSGFGTPHHSTIMMVPTKSV